jgi:hypothetical protein
MASSAGSQGPSPLPPSREHPAAIIHLDMDCFFAAVAEAEHPIFKGKPLVSNRLAFLQLLSGICWRCWVLPMFLLFLPWCVCRQCATRPAALVPERFPPATMRLASTRCSRE